MKKFQVSAIFLVTVVAVMVICATANASAEEAPKSEESRMKRQLKVEAAIDPPEYRSKRAACDVLECNYSCQSKGSLGGHCHGSSCDCEKPL